jgi:high affinity sulfate transporter 1
MSSRRFDPRSLLSPSLLATRPSLGDAVNGFTVAAITVPAALGYAVVAGLPPVYGLYAAMTSMIVFGLLGGNRFLILGPDAAFAAIIGATLASVSSVTGQRAPVLAPLLGLLVGIGFLALGALRAGKLASFLSQPLLAGFITGLAITIIIGQIPKILGIPSPSDTTLGKLGDIWDGLGDVQWQSVVLGLATIVLARLLGHLFPRAPVAAGLLILGLLAVVVLDLDDEGVDVVGEIDRGLPALDVPSFALDDMAALITGALALCAIGFADAVLQGRNYAAQAGDDPTPDRDVMAMGAANVANAFTSGYPVGASASRSSAAVGAGASSTWVSLLGGVVIAIVLLVLAPYLENLPIPVLAGVIVASASRLIRPRELTGLWPHRRAELLVGLVAAGGVILAGVIAGVGVALTLSLLQFVFRAANPPAAVLGRMPGRAGWWDVGRRTGAEPVPGVVVWRFEAPLFFANAEAFTTGLRAVLEHARSEPARGVPISTVVVEADGIVSIDATAAGALRVLLDQLAADGVEVRVAGAHAALRDQLTGVDALVAPERIFKTNDEAVADIAPPGP